MLYKPFLQFFLMAFFLFISLAAAATCIVSDASIGTSDHRILIWLIDNWYQVALVISEICALLPGKYTGIIKTLLSLFTELIKNYKKQFKNLPS